MNTESTLIKIFSVSNKIQIKTIVCDLWPVGVNEY